MRFFMGDCTVILGTHLEHTFTNSRCSRDSLYAQDFQPCKSTSYVEPLIFPAVSGLLVARHLSFALSGAEHSILSAERQSKITRHVYMCVGFIFLV